MIKRRVVFYVCAATLWAVAFGGIMVFADDPSGRKALINKAIEVGRKVRDPNVSLADQLKLAEELEAAMVGLEGSVEWLDASLRLAIWYNSAKAPKRAEAVARAALTAENVAARLQMDLYSQLFDALRKQGRYDDLESEKSRAHDLVIRQLQDKRIMGMQRNLWMMHLMETDEPTRDLRGRLGAADRAGEISALFAAYADGLTRLCTLFTDDDAAFKARWLGRAAYQYQMAGIIAARAGQFETARKYYNKALNVYPATIATGREGKALRFCLRVRLAHTGSLEYREAHRAEFEAVLKDYRNDDWFLQYASNGLGPLRSGLERFAALSVIDRMAVPGKKYIGGAGFYRRLGMEAELLGLREAAEQAYTTVIRHYPESSTLVQSAKMHLDALRTK